MGNGRAVDTRLEAGAGLVQPAIYLQLVRPDAGFTGFALFAKSTITGAYLVGFLVSAVSRPKPEVFLILTRAGSCRARFP